MEKHRAMKETKEILNLLVISAIVLLCFCSVATACPPPECPLCKYWSSSQSECVCRSDGSSCSSSSCKECQGCSCVYKSGNECEGDGDCSGECETCQNCKCEDDDSECNSSACEECNNGVCENRCDPPDVCCDGQCTSTCWTTQQESANYIPCPDCDNNQAGCYGTTESADGYTECVPATTGQPGSTQCTSRQAILGYRYVCDDADWDVSKIIGCAVGAGICYFACTVPNLVCVLCLIAEGASCALDGLCGFVDSCGPSEGQQGTPITHQVFDGYGGCGCTG